MTQKVEEISAVKPVLLDVALCGTHPTGGNVAHHLFLKPRKQTTNTTQRTHLATTPAPAKNCGK